jgi:hypothetical protein
MTMMRIRKFGDLFPDLAAQRMVTVHVERRRKRLPVELYWLIEYYCDEPDCDCRRMLLSAVAIGYGDRIFASIHFGWENPGFYRQWDASPDLRNARLLTQGVLDPAALNCDWADVILREVRKQVFSDPKAVRRFIKHYEMAKRYQRKKAREDARARRGGTGKEDP